VHNGMKKSFAEGIMSLVSSSISRFRYRIGISVLADEGYLRFSDLRL
jgi:hypothetical protein